MKKLNVLVLALLALVVGFTTSCDTATTEFDAPTVEFTQGDQTVDPETAVVIVGGVYAPGELDEIEYFKNDASYGDVITSFDSDTAHVFTVTIPAAEVTETFTFEVVATDKEGKKGKKTATITVSTAPTYEVKTMSNIDLNFDNSSTGNSTNVYSMADGVLNGFSGDGASFDIVFIWNSLMGYSYGSPDAAQVESIMEINGGSYAGSSNHTKFMSISSGDYDDADVDYINGLTVSDSETLEYAGGSGIQDASNGSTWAFETNDGTVGLFKVTGQSSKDKASAATTIEVKYVGEAATK